jgi:proteasome lid subunit RPN8/RPN11
MLDEIGFNGIIVRVCLSNSGNVGMTYVCRNSSDVKLQEYYMQILRLSKNDDNFGEDISKWIRSDVKTTLDRVRIGEGCHSNTMIVADDVISAHTAVSSTIVKGLFLNESKKNELYLSFAGCDYPGSFFTVNYSLPKYVSLNVDNNYWSVRIPEDLLEDIRTKTKVSGKNENGGYLVGLISEKRKTVYILDHFVPRDSGRRPTQLRLGTSGVKDFFDEWNKRSGGQVIYLGDWHSHPNGSVERSEQDKQTFSDLRFELESRGVCIITNGINEKAYII